MHNKMTQTDIVEPIESSCMLFNFIILFLVYVAYALKRV